MKGKDEQTALSPDTKRIGERVQVLIAWSRQLIADSHRLRSSMPRTVLPPHLMSQGKLKRCSVCGQTFGLDSQPSLSKAFAEHVRTVHLSKPEN